MTLFDTHIINSQKKRIRKNVLNKLRIMPYATYQSNIIIRRLLSIILKTKLKKIALTWPLPGEPNLKKLIYLLDAYNCSVFLPETPPKGHPLIFHQWHYNAIMKKGRYNTYYPLGRIGHPNIIIVPMVAYDKYLNRLGYGGGYYDRTIKCYPKAKLIGYAFSRQYVPYVPHDIHDYRLPIIVTEKSVLKSYSTIR